jgi:hypothetical protein
MLLSGCGGGSGDDVGGGGSTGNPDLAVLTVIDETTGFINMVDGANDTSVTNANGAEVNSFTGLYARNGFVYTTGSRGDDMLIKYAVNNDNSLSKVAEVNVYEGGGSIPTCIIFVNDTKAYLMLANVGELLVFDPSDLSISKRIDLSAYAMDANGEMGGDDANPEPSGGVIRDGKLYLALAQFDSFSSWQCRGKASVLIIDATTDAILDHISDDRTCNSGVTSPNIGLVLDELGDIYVVNTASFGYFPGMNAGILRIKSGEDDFDPDYYFSITDLTDLEVPGGVATYAYNHAYLSNGQLYTTLFIPGLTSNPPDYINDRNYVPYMLDVWNQTATKLEMPATNGWGAHMIPYNGDIIYGLAATSGNGLYYADEDTPFVTLDGIPYMMATYE